MKVLVVDDEAIIRRGIITLLQQMHADIALCMEAKNGKAALEMMEQELPDLIVSDIKMPVMDGMELIKAVKERQPHIAIVILTGYADFCYAQQALKYGVSDYLLKPVTKEKMEEMLLKIRLRTPDAWASDYQLVRVMKDTVIQLTRSMLGERMDEAEHLLAQWKQFCSQRKLTLLELQQLMSHFYVAYTAELIQHIPSVIEEELQLQQASSSAEELFHNWQLFLLEQVQLIADKRAPRNKRVVDLVITEIAASFSREDLNLQYLSECAGVSPAYLSKMFREVMNMPITQYISEYRLEQVRTKLENGDEERISTIAEQCGFYDYPYFSKVFKRAFGVSPLEYREKALS
ncbi:MULTISPECIES: response regulator transcription factor [unclassified Paenibacillus]|uniref:response regulator transcription factor n=1 Tax=unclassified Paenibacillus TaxID=185978 RepID=UPI002F4272EE